MKKALTTLMLLMSFSALCSELTIQNDSVNIPELLKLNQEQQHSELSDIYSYFQLDENEKYLLVNLISSDEINCKTSAYRSSVKKTHKYEHLNENISKFLLLTSNDLKGTSIVATSCSLGTHIINGNSSIKSLKTQIRQELEKSSKAIIISIDKIGTRAQTMVSLTSNGVSGHKTSVIQNDQTN